MGREITLASTKPGSALGCWATYASAFAAVAAAFAWPLSPSPYWNGLAAMLGAASRGGVGAVAARLREDAVTQSDPVSPHVAGAAASPT